MTFISSLNSILPFLFRSTPSMMSLTISSFSSRRFRLLSASSLPRDDSLDGAESSGNDH